MYGILLVIYVLVAICLIGLVLIQQGKGAQAGASFGSGASQTVFGSQGSSGFLSRATALLATAFFILNLALAYIVNHSRQQTSSLTMPVSSAPISSEDSGQTGGTGAGVDENNLNGESPADIPD